MVSCSWRMHSGLGDSRRRIRRSSGDDAAGLEGMMSNERFAFGDRVRHSKRPEWGIGSVVKAEDLSVNVESLPLGSRMRSTPEPSASTTVGG